MDAKMKELIAVGASVGAHCQPCLAYHVGKAKAMGIAEAEIREAIAVGHLVEKGAMSAMREFSGGVLGAPPPGRRVVVQAVNHEDNAIVPEGTKGRRDDERTERERKTGFRVLR